MQGLLGVLLNINTVWRQGNRCDFFSGSEKSQLQRNRVTWRTQVYTEPDVHKGSALTCDILAWVLEKLVTEHGLDLTSKRLHCQLDNCSSENKNNAVLQFCSFLVLTKKVKSMTVGFLQTGHTHEDIDMEHASLARHIAKRCRRALRFKVFVDATQEFLNQRSRTHEPGRYCIIINQVRDWKAFLFTMNIVIKGIAGPGAPHCFDFRCRGGLPRRYGLIEVVILLSCITLSCSVFHLLALFVFELCTLNNLLRCLCFPF